MGRQHKVEKRADSYSTRTVTRIWKEHPSSDNPYLAESCLCHGYDFFELIRKRSFVDVFFLLFSGELPNADQSKILETLMIGLINPGPRHPATKAAMSASVSKTNPAHILPLGASVMSGPHLGAEEVSLSMRFLQLSREATPQEAFEISLATTPSPSHGDWHISPGFGSRFGGIDPIPQRLAKLISGMPGCGTVIGWGGEYVRLMSDYGLGWLTTGLAAAVFLDLGFSPVVGAGMFQYMSAPGILAHGLEMVGKPMNTLPFLDDEHYEITEDAKAK